MNTPSIQQQKQVLRGELRKIMLQQRASLADPALIVEQVQQLPAWPQAHSILMYAPLAHEPNLLALLKKSSHRFFFPRMLGDELELYEWFSEATWVTGPHRIQEPDPHTWRRASLAKVDLALIPGLAFDEKGGRLGWGRGYFDRLLNDPTCRALKVGIAWPWQIVPHIPRENHDIKMDYVVTSEKIFQATL